MDLFNRAHLRDLAETAENPCISLYMPTFRFESEVSQNPIRFKNVLKDARKQLAEQGMDGGAIEELLAPAQQRLEENAYWRDQSDGLAVFITPDNTQFYRLPLHFEELAVAGHRFHLKPLFPLIASNNRFYVLALSQNSVRLYQGTHYSISEVESKEIPKSLTEALFYDDDEESLQHHTAGSHGVDRSIAEVESANQDTVYHGHGTSAEDDRHRPKDKLFRFFRDVDKGLKETLNDESAPLLLAGVKYYLPIYREVNSYGQLIDDEIIAGNPDRVKPDELHEKAWTIAEPKFAESQQVSIERYQQLQGNGDGLASNKLAEIVPASYYSRIDTVFVPIGEHLWGRYDSESNSVDLHDEHEAGDDDLLDFVAVNTYLNGGTVHALQPENMPSGSHLAATFRYQADVAASQQ